MNENDFEQRLRRQPMRQIPAAWRGEILNAAWAATPRASSSDAKPDCWWRELLWPCPQAWAGLAAVWVLIVALNLMTREQPKYAAKQAPPPPSSPQLLAALNEQRRLYVELLGLPEKHEVEGSTRSGPKPRSERTQAMMTA